MGILTRADLADLAGRERGPTFKELRTAQQWVARVAEERGTTVEKLTKGMESSEVFDRWLRREWKTRRG